MKKLLLTASAAVLALTTVYAASVSDAEIREVARQPHPRLLTQGSPAATLQANAKLPMGKLAAAAVLKNADFRLTQPVTPRQEKHGQRLLVYSRLVLEKITHLLVAWQLTGDDRYAEKAKAEMLAAAKNREWYLRFYLDCAEMTLAVSLAYDWLYDRLSPAERDLVANAIIEKGLKTSLQPGQWWVASTNNWCQVCHTAMVAAAIAVADREPAMARQIINRALKHLPKVMDVSYSANGTYPEGPGYWAYGTNYNCLLLALLDNAFGKSFGLDRIAGFDHTGDFILGCIGNTGKSFSYSDCSPGVGIGFANIYLAKKFNRPDWLAPQHYAALRELTGKKSSGNRLFPLTLFYIDAMPEQPDQSRTPKSYCSGPSKKVQIATLRSGFDRNDTYLGVKGGSPSVNHGHMDAGSFILESDGIRWCLDIGTSNYGNLEKKGIKRLFNSAQDSDRWKVFRLGAKSHNILRIDDQDQVTRGFAQITSASDSEVAVNLDTVYAGQAKTVRRTFKLLPDGAVEVRDELTGVRGSEVSAQFCTDATDIVSMSDGIRLEENGRKLKVTATSSAPGSWQCVPAAKLLQKWDVGEKGKYMIAYRVRVPDSGKVSLTMKFTPVREK